MLKRDITFLYAQWESPFLKHLLQSCKKIIHKGKQLHVKAVFQFTVLCLSFVTTKTFSMFQGSIHIYPFFDPGSVINLQKNGNVGRAALSRNRVFLKGKNVGILS